MQRCSSFFAMEAIANLSWVLHEHRADCRFCPSSWAFVEPAALLRARCQTLVRQRNPSKSTLTHVTVATTHHPIIRVGAGLVQFVTLAHGRGPHPRQKTIFAAIFTSFFPCSFFSLPPFLFFCCSFIFLPFFFFLSFSLCFFPSLNSHFFQKLRFRDQDFKLTGWACGVSVQKLGFKLYGFGFRISYLA